ncbi:MAG: 6,7-dimethyl-8-ribityllumazine synthase [Betaproteobacteria bacterium]
MAIKKITPDVNGAGKKIGIVLSRFNSPIGGRLLKGAQAALREAGVTDSSVLLVTVPGALETPLALQYLAQTRRFDALVALGAVIRGETYHFEIVANESASGVSGAALEFGVPVGNGILTTNTDEQALARAEEKGREAVLAAIEMSNLQAAIGDHEK